MEFDDEGVKTVTSASQRKCENDCLGCFLEHEENNLLGDLLREKHIHYIKISLNKLPGGFISLDASRPWLIYWMIHSLSLLDAEVDQSIFDGVVETLACYQNPLTGGFGGGSHQLSHCAPTYSACLSLCIVGTDAAYGIIDRKKMYQFFLSMKTPSGGFRMHNDGETDVRATYTVLAVSSILNIMTPELIQGTADWVCSCQTYEGGFGGEPFNEAHGGYTFCGFASLLILGETKKANVRSLLKWICRRQMSLEGGFQGRTNKLVDACYSFWQGSIPAMLALSTDWYYSAKGRAGFGEDSRDASHSILGDLIIDQIALQKYLLQCCQEQRGGLRDKPSKHRDHYHTCYALSGLSIAQNSGAKVIFPYSEYNHLRPTDPVYNICTEKLKSAMEFFAKLQRSHEYLIG